MAGDLGSIHSEYKTTSGKVVQLGIFSDKENVGEYSVMLAEEAATLILFDLI